MGKDIDLQTEERFAFTLPNLLNILFRGRWVIAAVTALGLIAGIGYGIVVKPLYRASVQIRPGIVSYTDEGGPLRGWVREDIVHFFESSLYWQDLREAPGFKDMKSSPIIRAEFVPSAIQFMPGGDVITLTNLSTDPGQAVKNLEGALASFNSQVSADTLSSDLDLTRRGINVRMRGISIDIDLVEAKEEKVALDIERTRGELKLIDYERGKLALDLKTLEQENAWRQRAVETTLAEVENTRKRLVSAEEMLASALEAEKASSGQGDPATGAEDPVSEVLKQTASREQAGRVGDLLVTVDNLSTNIYEGSVKADSLQARITANEQEMGRLKLVGDILLTKREADVQQTIQDLEINLKRELPHERAMLETNLEGERVKLENLSPLERVGRISVSSKPVRPRKMRAAGILTALAFFGALGLVLVWEYFQVNRGEITRPHRI